MNIANKLTFMRMILVPVFVLFMYLPGDNYRMIATIIFVAASFTDFLDGYLARKNGLVTTFGKFADPLADKILVATIILLSELGIIPGWTVIVIIAREFAITGFRVIAASENITIAAGPLGKIKTATQMVGIILILLNYTPLVKIGIILYYISVFFTILSGVDYIVRNKEVLDLENI